MVLFKEAQGFSSHYLNNRSNYLRFLLDIQVLVLFSEYLVRTICDCLFHAFYFHIVSSWRMIKPVHERILKRP